MPTLVNAPTLLTVIFLSFLAFCFSTIELNGVVEVHEEIQHSCEIDSDSETAEIEMESHFEDYVDDVYEDACFSNYDLDRIVVKRALCGYFNLLEKSALDFQSTFTLVDYSKPSTEPRLYVVDLKNKFIEHESLVSHGRNSGLVVPKHFSNKMSSYKTSLGFYKTGRTYTGQHGHSLRLDGLEKGINDRARARAIVMHPADYVSEMICREYGYLGRSFGCPSLPPGQSKEIIGSIKDGTCMFLIAEDEDYLKNTDLLNFSCASQFLYNNKHEIEQYL